MSSDHYQNPNISNDPIDITVMVSCYNEQDTIVDTLENTVSSLEEVGLSYEIIVIDDHSTDNSSQRVLEYQTRHPSNHITLKVNEKNLGLAYNYVDCAFLGRGKYFRLICGDNVEPKNTLIEVFKYTGKADIILAYQIQNKVIGKSAFRKLLSMTFTKVVNLISGFNIKYYNGLATHLRYNVMRWHPISYGFGFQADILTMLLEQGSSYIQVLVEGSVDRKPENSTALTMRNFLSVCHTLLEIAIRRFRKILYGKNWPKPVELNINGEGLQSQRSL